MKASCISLQCEVKGVYAEQIKILLKRCQNKVLNSLSKLKLFIRGKKSMNLPVFVFASSNLCMITLS